MGNKKIDAIEGIGPVYTAKLAEAGIRDTDTLLDRTCTRKGRNEVATSCDIPASLVLGWANMADLFRIDGIGTQFAELLECAGVDSVKELRSRNAGSVAEKLSVVNAEKKLTRVVPGAGTVQKWITQAKDLPPRLEY